MTPLAKPQAPTAANEPAGAAALRLRPPAAVMRLDRMGAAFPTRLSFLRVLLRRMQQERWTFSRPCWNIDTDGYGLAVIRAVTPSGPLSLVAFSKPLAADQRTDRVIAEAWDTSYVLFDGDPTPADLERLSQSVPRQEAARYTQKELVLARANRSVRLFDEVVETLAAGRQPDAAVLNAVGYLMRTTAVYGNGKFGIADRERLLRHPALQGPFQAEMLTVYLIRAFTVELAEHVARARAPDRAVALTPDRRRLIGVGNSTGLGMAPFLVRHPALLNRWVTVRETALARVRALPVCSTATAEVLRTLLRRWQTALAGWETQDADMASRTNRLLTDLSALETYLNKGALQGPQPFERLYQQGAATAALDAQELLVTLLLEPHGSLIDDLAGSLAFDDAEIATIDGTRSVRDLSDGLRARYGFARELNPGDPAATDRFWYVSAAKLEPRLGERGAEPGSALEQPLSIARDVAALANTLAELPPDLAIADLLARHPEHRHVVRRVQGLADHPYSEIADNLLAASMRPVDLLRYKLAFFGASRFDPRSDRWLRVTFFQGAPFPDALADHDADDWAGGADWQDETRL